MYTNGIVGWDKNNLACMYMCKRHRAAHSLCYNQVTFQVLLIPINMINRSKKVLILYGCVQGIMD